MRDSWTLLQVFALHTAPLQLQYTWIIIYSILFYHFHIPWYKERSRSTVLFSNPQALSSHVMTFFGWFVYTHQPRPVMGATCIPHLDWSHRYLCLCPIYDTFRSDSHVVARMPQVDYSRARAPTAQLTLQSLHCTCAPISLVVKQQDLFITFILFWI